MTPTAWSLVPPLLALVLAVGTRRVVPSLAAGGLVGTLLMAWRDPAVGAPEAVLVGLLDFVRLGILGQASEPSNAQVLVLIVLIGGFVRLLEASGAARALASAITARAASPRRAQLATWGGGLVLFFSDFGNVLILGPVFQPVYDRMGLSRERLAWIIDTTAAPVCVLVPVIAWGVYAIGLIETAFSGLSPAEVEAVLPGLWDPEAGTVDGFATFLTAVPFQLYPLLSLVFVPAMVLAGRDWGPMRHTVATPETAETATAEEGPGVSAALVPLGLLFGVMLLVGLYTLQTEGRLTGASVRVGLAAAYLTAILGCVATLGRTGHAAGATAAVQEGMGRAIPLLVLLVLAWTLGEVCAGLGTGAWMAAAIGDGMPPALLPFAVFVVGATVSFATGTSWGTFAILMPIAIPMAVALGAPAAVTIGAVLSGGVFGDHCSPISDTTLLASMGAGTDHARHVATQLPYALVVGGSAGICFTLAGWTGAPWSVGAGAVLVLAAVAASRLGGEA